MNKLPHDANLEYIVNNGLVNRPSDWIRGVFGNLLKLPKEYGPYCVRIGLTGTGHSPNYRIEPINEAERTPEDDEATIFNIPNTPRWAYLEARNNAFDGRNHKKTSRLSGLAQDNWSTRTSTEQEIKDLLQRLRSVPRI